jgi:hypothetical protein
MKAKRSFKTKKSGCLFAISRITVATAILLPYPAPVDPVYSVAAQAGANLR